MEDEHEEEYKRKTFEEHQKDVMNFYNILTENVGIFLSDLEWKSLTYRKDFDGLVESIIDFLPFVNINEFSKMKQVTQNTDES